MANQRARVVRLAGTLTWSLLATGSRRLALLVSNMLGEHAPIWLTRDGYQYLRNSGYAFGNLNASVRTFINHLNSDI
jgi:hypothetical protein